MMANLSWRLGVLVLLLGMGLGGCASAPCTAADFDVGGACYDDDFDNQW